MGGRSKKLNKRQKAFCDIILLMERAGSVNQTEAYKLAGYKQRGKNAIEKASKLLKNSQCIAYLTHARAQRGDKVQKSEAEIIEEYEKLAYTNLTDVMSFDNYGVFLTASRNLSEKAKAALKSVVMREFKYKNKKGKTNTVTTVKVELHDKKGSLDSLAKIKGMMNKPIGVEIKELPPVQVIYTDGPKSNIHSDSEANSSG